MQAAGRSAPARKRSRRWPGALAALAAIAAIAATVASCVLPSYREEADAPAALAAACDEVWCDPANEGAECDDGNPCTNDLCDPAFHCVCVPLADGTPTPGVSPAIGDCGMEICVAGKGVRAPLLEDLPLDVPCVDEACGPDGTPISKPTPAGAPCDGAAGGATQCNGQGQCVGCLVDGECPTTVCHVPKCEDGTCAIVPAGAGMPLPDELQTANDCRRLACDAAGGVVSEPDPLDLPADDGNECTEETCAGGSPQHLPKLGASCAGGRCDATGVCVQCLEHGDCPDPGACRTPVCVNNVCSATNDPKNSPCGGGKCDGLGNCVNCTSDSDCGNDTDCIDFECEAGACVKEIAIGAKLPGNKQKKGDCKVLVCNPLGVPVPKDDDSDVPADDGNPCTEESCKAGAPKSEVLVGASCGGDQLCNDAGHCVDCLTDSDCTPETCKKASCTGGACTYAPVGKGTPCQGGKCDGNGQCSGCLDPMADCPPKECSVASCAAGACSYAPAQKGTPCSDGKACDGAGKCSLGALGAPCDGGAQCASGSCVLGHCCETDSCPSCKSCTTGTCKPDDNLSCYDCGGPDAGQVPECHCENGVCVPD